MISVSYLLELCRQAVSGQINTKRKQLFSSTQDVRCAITNLPLTSSMCDIDHQPPLTFEQLVYDWCCSADLFLIELNWDTLNEFAQSEYWQSSWQSYHEEMAILRPVHRQCNLHLPKSKCNWTCLTFQLVITLTSWEADEVFGAKQMSAMCLQEAKKAETLPSVVWVKDGRKLHKLEGPMGHLTAVACGGLPSWKMSDLEMLAKKLLTA